MKGGRKIPPPSMKERARLEREREFDIQEEFERSEREREQREERQRREIAELQMRLEHTRALRVEAQERQELARQLQARTTLLSQGHAEADSRSNSRCLPLGNCSVLGGRIKNILRKKNKSNKNKSKRVNKQVKNKRYSRKYFKRYLH